MLNTKRNKEFPLYSFNTQNDLEWYVLMHVSVSQKEYDLIMERLNNNLPYVDDSTPHIQYEVRLGE
jgi:hypothetical protein